MSDHQYARARFATDGLPDLLPRRTVVLVPVDPSSVSFAAVKMGVSAARQTDGELVFFHAVHLNLSPYGPANLVQLRAALRREALEQLEPLVHYARAAGVPVRCEVEDGAEAEAILKEARKLKADMIVLGSRPRGFFARRFSRRLREQVTRGADCPVLVVEKKRAKN